VVTRALFVTRTTITTRVITPTLACRRGRRLVDEVDRRRTSCAEAFTRNRALQNVSGTAGP